MNRHEVIYLAGGCFWCTEAIFQNIKGVKEVVPGYIGGSKPNPTYQQVCSGTTGHAEAIRLVFNEHKTSLEKILFIFFYTHDPTSLNQQGNDIGTQYRSEVFYSNKKQKKEVQKLIQQLEEDSVYENPIVTKVSRAVKFYPAEKEHHNYYRNNPQQTYCQIVLNPKLKRLREYFSAHLKKSNELDLIQ